MGNEVLAIIPARGGSKGIPRKNLRKILDRPLIYYSIAAALQAKNVNRVVVSTDDGEIAEVAREVGAEVPFMRPAEFASDNVHSVYALIDAVQMLRDQQDYLPDAVVMLLPTSPLVRPVHIDSAVEIYMKRKKGAVISVCSFDKPLSAIREIKCGVLEPVVHVENFNVQRQEYDLFLVNAAIYVASPLELIEKETFHMEEVYPYIMAKDDSLDINDANDFEIAEFLISKHGSHK